MLFHFLRPSKIAMRTPRATESQRRKKPLAQADRFDDRFTIGAAGFKPLACRPQRLRHVGDLPPLASPVILIDAA
jgi:hypothetical protein